MIETQRLASLIGDLLDVKASIHDEVELVIGKYWVRWKLKNREIIKARVAGDKRINVGKVAPSLRVYKGENSASYVRWRLYDNPYGQVNLRDKQFQKFAKEFRREKNGQTRLSNLIDKSQEWERSLIEETHKQLQPLVSEMHGINEAVKKLNVAIRAIEKLNN